MTATRHPYPPSHPRRADPGSTRSARIGSWTWSDPVVRAWAAIALIPVFAVLAFGVPHGVYLVSGYRVGIDDAPAWVARAVGLTGFVTFLVPCLLAVRYANRARAGRDPRGWAPLLVGGLVAGWWLVTGMVALVGSI